MEQHNHNHSNLGLLRQPDTVVFGPGQRREIPSLAARYGSTVLICTDERMSGELACKELIHELESTGQKAVVYTDISPDLPRNDLRKATAELANQEIDVVIGLGGGSCMDFAKVLAVLLVQPGDVRELFGQNRVQQPGLPVITVPTTGGTGAEATCISVVLDEETAAKVGVASPFLEPVATVIDPELTLTAPKGLTAATGTDALSHLIEAYTGRAKNPSSEDIRDHLYVGKNLLTDIWAEHGLRVMGRSLPALARDLTDLQARTDVMLGAFCAGMAINTAGTAGCHALQAPIGALTHTPHGFGIGALLPYLMRYNLPARVPEFARMGELLGDATTGTELQRAQQAVERVEELVAELGSPTDLSELGMTEADVPQMAESAMASTRLIDNNPRPITVEVAEEILRRGVRGDRSWWER